MVSEINIYHSALIIIKGNQNPKSYAFAKSSALHALGDMEGAVIWARIADAIEKIGIDIPDEKFH